VDFKYLLNGQNFTACIILFGVFLLFPSWGISEEGKKASREKEYADYISNYNSSSSNESSSAKSYNYSYSSGKKKRFGDYCVVHKTEDFIHHSSKSSSGSSKKDKDWYDVDDYADADDFYDENYEDFDDFEDAEDYYDEYSE